MITTHINRKAIEISANDGRQIVVTPPMFTLPIRHFAKIIIDSGGPDITLREADQLRAALLILAKWGEA